MVILGPLRGKKKILMKEMWHKKLFSAVDPSLEKNTNYKYRPHSGPTGKLGGKALRLIWPRSHTLEPVSVAR